MCSHPGTAQHHAARSILHILHFTVSRLQHAAYVHRRSPPFPSLPEKSPLNISSLNSDCFHLDRPFRSHAVSGQFRAQRRTRTVRPGAIARQARSRRPSPAPPTLSRLSGASLLLLPLPPNHPPTCESRFTFSPSFLPSSHILPIPYLPALSPTTHSPYSWV